MATTTRSRSPSPTPSRLPPVPASPTYSYASTANPISAFNLPLPPPPRPAHAVLTKSDLESSQTAYSELLNSAKQYRLALAALSTAASAFGSALEVCARLKEARSETLHSSAGSMANSFMARGSCTADLLMAASGVHHLIANHQQILSETVYRNFEVPLLHEIDGWQRRMEEEEVTYQREAKERSKEIRKMEKEGLKLHKQRKRDVAKFRSHLVNLTNKLDGLTSLHGEHSRTLLRDSQETSLRIVEASSSLVRAEVDIFEGLARKGWSGGGLDELLDKGVDLFANEDEISTIENSKLFSILPQKSILADTSSVSAGHARNDSLHMDEDRYQSLAGAVTNQDAMTDDNRSIFSEGGPEGNFNRPRGVRPFSPPPKHRRDRPEVLRASGSTGNKSFDGRDAAGKSSGSIIRESIEEGEESTKENLPAGTDSMRGRERKWSVTDDPTLSE